MRSLKRDRSYLEHEAKLCVERVREKFGVQVEVLWEAPPGFGKVE